uniref:Uncharacterized protein n=1 Tax=Populus davidiana TaxID=266767 RepID=A0A6M2EIC5_9ROSI
MLWVEAACPVFSCRLHELCCRQVLCPTWIVLALLHGFILLLLLQNWMCYSTLLELLGALLFWFARVGSLACYFSSPACFPIAGYAGCCCRLLAICVRSLLMRGYGLMVFTTGGGSLDAAICSWLCCSWICYSS